MAALSILLSLVSYFTVFLGLTVVVLQPIAAIVGYLSYRAFVREKPEAPTPLRVIAAIPFVVAVGVFGWGMWLLNAEYHV